jgi:prevent-host-death family protein
MDEEVALRDANQQFAKYVRAVEGGQSFVITRRGKPVARLVPIESGKRVLTPEQQAARQRARAWSAGSTWAARGSAATSYMSAEPYTLDTNILIYAVDPSEGRKHAIGAQIVDRSVELPCILTVQALAEFVAVATRRRMRSRADAVAQARGWLRSRQSGDAPHRSRSPRRARVATRSA